MNACSLHSQLKKRAFIKQSLLTASLLSAIPTSVFGQAAKTFKAVVIGHTSRGDYGHSLETIFSNRPNIQLLALADADETGRKRTADKIGASRQYADYREMLEKERPQLVSIAMRHADQHFAIAMDCLKSDAHIYCEKPFTTCSSESDELLNVAKKRGLRIAVAHTMRMMPIIQRLRQGLSEGLIGDLVEMRAYGKQDTRAGGEDMMVLGSHLFDLMRLFAGDPLWCSSRILWKGRDMVKSDARLVKDNIGLLAGDQVHTDFAFPNNVHATFTSSNKLQSTVGQWGIELLGSKGSVRVNCDISPNVFIKQPTAWKAEGKSDAWKPLDVSLIKAPPPHNLGPVGDWIEAILQNREPECSGRNAAWAVEMVMAAYYSALGAKRVAFPLADRSHPLAN